MKRHIPPIAPTNRKRSLDAGGGLTLETALVMPIFLLFVFFLISIIQSAVISMALHNALSQTAKQASTAWYPISLVLEQARSSEINQQIEEWNDKWQKAGETVQQIAQWLPSPIKDWAQQASNGSFSLEEQVSKQAFRQLVEQFVDDKVLDSSRITITSAQLPDQQDRTRAYLTLQAEYTLPFRIPFTDRKLVLRESVRERVWIGGSPSLSRVIEEEALVFAVTFVSLEPNPVRPGRKATLVLRTKPGTVVDLSIVYKSGLSQAKHLGSATADASGLVSWTWHVSGRTTPGQWNWKVINRAGEVWQESFQVAGKKE